MEEPGYEASVETNLNFRQRYSNEVTKAEHFRGPERFRGRATVPGGTIPLAEVFRGNKYASGLVPPEHWRGGTNPL